MFDVSVRKCLSGFYSFELIIGLLVLVETKKFYGVCYICVYLPPIPLSPITHYLLSFFVIIIHIITHKYNNYWLIAGNSVFVTTAP